MSLEVNDDKTNEIKKLTYTFEFKKDVSKLVIENGNTHEPAD